MKFHGTARSIIAFVVLTLVNVRKTRPVSLLLSLILHVAMVISQFGENATAGYPISCQDTGRKAEKESEDTTKSSRSKGNEKLSRE